MKVDEATAIIERAIQEACSRYLFEKASDEAIKEFEDQLDEAVADGTLVKWSKREDGETYDYWLVPKRPTEFINLNFVATAEGVVFS